MNEDQRFRFLALVSKLAAGLIGGLILMAFGVALAFIAGGWAEHALDTAQVVGAAAAGLIGVLIGIAASQAAGRGS